MWQPNREEIDVCGFAFAGAAQVSTATGCPAQTADGSVRVVRVRGISDKRGGAMFDSGVGLPPPPFSEQQRGLAALLVARTGLTLRCLVVNTHFLDAQHSPCPYSLHGPRWAPIYGVSTACRPRLKSKKGGRTVF